MVSPLQFCTTYLASSRVKMLNHIADWLSHEKLSAVPEKAVQCMIIPRVRADRTLASVTILNTVIGKQKTFRLKLRDIPAGTDRAIWNVPGEKPVSLPLTRSGEETFVSIPEIAAWDIGWLEL